MPKRTQSVAAFLDSLDHPRKADIVRIRSIIRCAIPDAEEHIKWNAPSFAIGGIDRVTMRLHPRGLVQLIFHRGAKRSVQGGFQFEDPWGLLEWAAADRGVLTFASSEDVSQREEAIADLVRRWVAVPVPR